MERRSALRAPHFDCLSSRLDAPLRQLQARSYRHCRRVRVQDSEPRARDCTFTLSFPWIYPNPAELALRASEGSSLRSDMSQHLTRWSERAPTPVRPHLLSRSRRNALRLAAPLGNEALPRTSLTPQCLSNEGKSRRATRIQRTLHCLPTSSHCSID